MVNDGDQTHGQFLPFCNVKFFRREEVAPPTAPAVNGVWVVNGGDSTTWPPLSMRAWAAKMDQQGLRQEL